MKFVHSLEALFCIKVSMTPRSFPNDITYCRARDSKLIILLEFNALIHIRETSRLYLTPKSFCAPMNDLFASFPVVLRPQRKTFGSLLKIFFVFLLL